MSNVSYGDLKDFLIEMEAVYDTLFGDVEAPVSEICTKLRIGRLDVRFYDNPEKEKSGKRNTLPAAGSCRQSGACLTIDKDLTRKTDHTTLTYYPINREATDVCLIF